jgi:predicted AlkP superfamily pyrophosphatase or phosphodiesterase
MRRHSVRRAAILLLASVIAWTMALGAQPSTQHRRVFIVSIDGLRPDLLLRADAPRIRALVQRASFTFWARTIAEGYTVPSHVSMLTGVVPERHGVTWDSHIEDAYPNVPTLFELAKQAGLSTAVVTGKTKLIVLTKPGTLDWKHIANEDVEGDLDVANDAAMIVRAHRPDVMFVHLGHVDLTGHDDGWGSTAQMKAIETADRAFGILEDALVSANVSDATLLILTADHGGAALLHPPEDPRSQFIPWIVTGPGVRKNFDLTQVEGLTVDTMSTFATACDYLGITVPYAIDGRPTRAIFVQNGQSAPPPRSVQLSH